MPLTLLTGGARAGKSDLAARLARETASPVVYIATAQALDDDMARRITRHRAERPDAWRTIEEPLDLERALTDAGDEASVIVDCLTLWVTNLLLEDHDEDAIAERAERAAARAAGRPSPTFAVTNEVGAGVVPASELGRRFRDVLGRVNAIWSSHANEAFLVVAGRALTLERWR